MTYDIIFNINTTSLIRPLLGSPKGGLNIGITGILYLQNSYTKECLLSSKCVHFQNREGLTLLHSERPKLYAILAFLSAIGLREQKERDELYLSYTVPKTRYRGP